MTAQEKNGAHSAWMKEKNEHCNYMQYAYYGTHTHTHKHSRDGKLNGERAREKKNQENKMHVIYNRLRLILLPVDGWRHVIFTFGCMQAHQTQERAQTTIR